MELTLNQAVMNVQMSGIRRFTALARSTPGACTLTIGEPDQNTPEGGKEAAKAALDANDPHYPPNNGYPYLLEAISKFEERAHGLPYAPDEIIVTIGATEALYISLSTILNPGDEVIIPTPAFSLYESITQLCRGVAVHLPTEKNRFQIDPEALRTAITPKTKAIVLTSPNNPTGCIYTKETLDAIHDVLRDKPIFVLCDDVYRQLVYTEGYHSFAEYQDMRDRIIVIQSFSKPYAMTGWRVGYLVAPEETLERLLLLCAAQIAAVPTFVQAAAQKALEVDTEPMRQIYAKRRAYVLSRLEGMGLSFPTPEGAFYVFPDISKYGIPSWEFCTRMIREGRLAAVPGVCFGAEGYIRLSYCYSDEELKAGLDNMEAFLKGL